MEPKKNPKLDTTYQVPVFTMVGLVVALLMVFMAFNWTQTEVVEQEVFKEEDLASISEEDDNVEIPMTVQVPPPPMPVVQEPVIKEVPDETEIKEEVEMPDVEEKKTHIQGQDNTNKVVRRDFKGKQPPPPPPQENIEDNTIKEFADVQPTFPGGDEGFKKFLKSNLKYPKNAKRQRIQGKVYVRFVVEKDGSVTQVQVVRGIGGGCDEAAMKIVKSSPKWKPGEHRFKPVRVRMVVPISFKLK